jgi:hypothetical protein
MVIHFLWHLPQHFEYLFHFPSLFLNSLATNSCQRFDIGKIPGRYHGFYLHCPEGKEKIWKLYKTSDKIFLFLAKNLLLFLNNFYKFHAQNEWENVRQKIPPELGLYVQFLHQLLLI